MVARLTPDQKVACSNHVKVRIKMLFGASSLSKLECNVLVGFNLPTEIHPIYSVEIKVFMLLKH